MTKTIDTLKNEIENDAYAEKLSMLYGENAQTQKRRYLSLLAGFEKRFGKRKVGIFSAPGRTELCGNHTDHQNGCVLAAAVDCDMAAAVSPRDDSVVRIVSEGFGELEIDLSDLTAKSEEMGSSAALIRGVASAINNKKGAVVGFDAYIQSDVPQGSGMSSSAAFEVLVGKIFSVLYCGNSMSPVELAMMGQYAENKYFGKPCGLMDQMACAVGGVVYIDFFDPVKPKVEAVDFCFEKKGYSLCITNAGGSHADLTDDYAAITREMGAVSRFFGAEKLSGVDEREFMKCLPELRKKVSDRAVLRAMHFFEENRRVKIQLSNLKNGSIEQYLEVMGESGKSSMGLLQNLWPSDENERSVALALALSDGFLGKRGVSRVHGGGFAGTIQALVPTPLAEEYRLKMDSVFGENACRKVRIRPVGAFEL